MSAAPDFDPEYASAADWAREYRRHGLQVVPCYAPSEVAKGKPWKRPRFHEWTEFQETLVADTVFDRWYGAQGEYAQRINMGIITGRASGNLLVIDLDIHKKISAQHWWAGLLSVHNNDMQLETATQKTGGGGVQMLFRAPSGWICPTNRTPIGVDVRGQGGFAVIAPSLHDSGAFYDWMIGLAPWEVGIAEAPPWLLTAVEELVAKHGGDMQPQLKPTRTASPAGDYDAFGNQHDGREEKMRDVVWAAVVDWRRECPIKPGETEQRLKASTVYEAYERTVVSRLVDPKRTKTQLLDQEGRGPTAFWQKWQAAMKHWNDKVAEEAKKPKPEDEKKYRDYGDEFAQATEEGAAKAKATSNLYEYFAHKEINNMPQPKWLVRGLVAEQALGFIYGPPGCLKTFIALDLAMSLSARVPQWWGRDIQRGGAVVYITSEGVADLKFRLRAWQQHRGVDNWLPFFLIRENINFMKGDDVGRLLATVDEIWDVAGEPIAAVFVDTVSRVLPGAEENLQKDMTLFVAACDAVRMRFNATVIGIHHSARAGNMRGSTVIPGAGDFVVEVRREPGATAGSIFAFKIKGAQDGWEQFFAVQNIVLPDIGGHSSLVLDAVDQAPKREGAGGWPPIDVCRQILAAIDEQWMAGLPWCFAKNTARAAVVNISKRFRLKKELVEDILTTWTANGVIAEEVRNPTFHVKGYRKLINI